MPLLCAALMLAQALLFCRAPLPVLLDRLMPDDAFYFFQPARVFAHSGFSSFDGLHFTNGYQPLWFLLCVPVFWIIPAGGEAAVRLIQVVQIPLAVGAVWLLARALVRTFGPRAAAAPAFFFAVKFGPAMMRGVEAALAMCLYAALFLRVAPERAERPGRARALGLGVLLGLLFLARTDMVFTVAAVASALAVRELLSTDRDRIARLACLLLPVAILDGGYLMTNLAATGHLMPVSGAVKLYSSEVARARAVAGLGSPAAALAANLRVFDPFVLAGALGPWALLGLSRVPALRDRLPRGQIARWPFFLGATFSFLFYALAFHDPLNRTEWYYGPHLFLACWTLAAVVAMAGSWLPDLGLVSAPGRTGRWAGSAFGLAAIALLALLVAARPIAGLARRSVSAPRGWNHALYDGALWARAHLPPDATIASGNAGILGYFSGRRVINTDGLANDYAYLENVIRPGRVLAYSAGWDYVLDAFPEGYRLERDLPAAREVPLPPDPAFRFRDGDVTRELRLYRMR